MRPVVVVSDGPGTPSLDPVAAARRAGVDDGILFLGWMVDDRSWIRNLGTWPAVSYQPVSGLAAAAKAGHVEYLPARLASIPALLNGPFAPAVAVVPGVRRGSGFAFTENVGYADTAVRLAESVIVEVVDGPDMGAPPIAGKVVEVLDGGPGPVPPSPRTPSETDRRIAAMAAAMVPEGATVQYGLGRLPEAVVRSIDRRVSVISGLVTDAVLDLHDRGLLVGQPLTSYVWGGDDLLGMVHEGRIRPVGIEELHRGGRLASTPRFVSINAALEVGLDGAVNIERAGSRSIAGIGGHADYCEAATRSPGGISLVVLPSTHGGRSSIVTAPSVVSTPRVDVHVVVTEHGIADLRGLGESARRRALLAIADPAHRPQLERTSAESP
ncbi:MAG TPA: acetyl-CoA hydrolase/transferase C-terminal domain-containing protein [Acidimicrobiales bacterium]|nr:acetyl-CoA hydrolase/transferase C-terminal domain-containing protein [Acidimicrobiales bacterium]